MVFRNKFVCEVYIIVNVLKWAYIETRNQEREIIKGKKKRLGGSVVGRVVKF